MSDNQDEKTAREAQANAGALAEIAAKLQETGLAPEGDYLISAVTGAALDRLAVLEVELGAARETMAALEGSEAEARADLAAAKRQLKAQKGQTTRARKAVAEALASLPGAKARTAGALEKPFTADELLAAIDDADEAQVVAFLDGREVLAVPTLALAGGAAGFRIVAGGVGLSVPHWLVQGPGPGERTMFDAWGLFLDGELAAFTRRAGGQLTIGSGQTFDLATDVFF